MTTKIVALVDALGNLVRFILQPGQRNDIMGVKPLIEGIRFDALLADKAFDADWLRKELEGRGAMAVIPPRPSSSFRNQLQHYGRIKRGHFNGLKRRYRWKDHSTVGLNP